MLAWLMNLGFAGGAGPGVDRTPVVFVAQGHAPGAVLAQGHSPGAETAQGHNPGAQVAEGVG